MEEVNAYPLKFTDSFQVESVMLEITKHCTNYCPHCANYGSPKQKEYLELPLIKNIVDQIVEMRHSTIFLWGGEPFLHPNFSEILEYCLNNSLNIYCNTNAFWAVSEQAVQSFVDKFVSLLREKQNIKLAISCDKFHQEQRPTPLKHIVNLLTVLDKNSEWFDYEIQSVDTIDDGTFSDLLNVLPEHVAQACLHKHKMFPLEYSIGRAKKMLPGAELHVCPQDKNTIKIFAEVDEVRIYVTATGECVLYENWVGDKILSLGNARNVSLKKIENVLNSSKFFKLLHFQPVKYFFYPFRKYLDLRKLTIDISAGKIRDFYFLRDAVAELMQIKEKQFDRSADLALARAVYLDKFAENKALRCLDVIGHYGDFTDTFALRYLLSRTNDEKIKQKVEELLATIYS
jgi:organic radical activating enzyme